MVNRKVLKRIRQVQSLKELRHPIKGIIKVEGTVFHESKNNGYIRVRTLTDKDGKIHGLSRVDKRVRNVNSIHLFIAGGSEIDEKVAMANAALRIKL